jgi:hypothetical protein
VIRNFLKWAYVNWEVSWVLLGGDLSIVPIRMAASGKLGMVDCLSTESLIGNVSFWTGTYLKMHVAGFGDRWGYLDWPLILVNPASGKLIPNDPDGTSDTIRPGWYYTTDNSYTIRSPASTEFIRVNGPEELIHAKLQFLYRWNQIPTDLYYSSLSGPHYNVLQFHDWDLVDNGVYGQHTDNVDMDGVNYASSIHVGRAPVESVAEAEVFVNKVIAYEQFRSPDGRSLDLDWPRRLTLVSINWNPWLGIKRVYITPPGDNSYYHNNLDPYTLIQLAYPMSYLNWNLFAAITETDVRILPYNAEAAAAGTMEVVVTAFDYLPYFGKITVEEAFAYKYA